MYVMPLSMITLIYEHHQHHLLTTDAVIKLFMSAMQSTLSTPMESIFLPNSLIKAAALIAKIIVISAS